MIINKRINYDRKIAGIMMGTREYDNCLKMKVLDNYQPFEYINYFIS